MGVASDWLVAVADETPEALDSLLDREGWGDGLPVVAPTPTRVDAMLAAGSGDPDETLGVLEPRLGIITRRVVAINAVLAGCRPAVFPVVLTAVRGAGPARSQPPGGQRHDASGSAVGRGARGHRANGSIRERDGSLRPGESRQRHSGSCSAPRTPPRRGGTIRASATPPLRVNPPSTPTAWRRISTNLHGSRMRQAAVSMRRAR